jgi:hypothetical protein
VGSLDASLSKSLLPLAAVLGISARGLVGDSVALRSVEGLLVGKVGERDFICQWRGRQCPSREGGREGELTFDQLIL